MAKSRKITNFFAVSGVFRAFSGVSAIHVMPQLKAEVQSFSTRPNLSVCIEYSLPYEDNL